MLPKSQNHKLDILGPTPSIDIEKIVFDVDDFVSIEYLFRKDNKLIGFLTVNLEPEYNSTRDMRISNTTSSSGYKYLTESIKSIYDINCNSGELCIDGMGQYYLEYVLEDLMKNYPNENILKVEFYEENKKALNKTLEKLKKLNQDTIQDIISKDYYFELQLKSK